MHLSTLEAQNHPFAKHAQPQNKKPRAYKKPRPRDGQEMRPELSRFGERDREEMQEER